MYVCGVASHLLRLRAWVISDVAGRSIELCVRTRCDDTPLHTKHFVAVAGAWPRIALPDAVGTWTANRSDDQAWQACMSYDGLRTIRCSPLAILIFRYSQSLKSSRKDEVWAIGKQSWYLCLGCQKMVFWATGHHQMMSFLNNIFSSTSPPILSFWAMVGVQFMLRLGMVFDGCRSWNATTFMHATGCHFRCSRIDRAVTSADLCRISYSIFDYYEHRMT